MIRSAALIGLGLLCAALVLTTSPAWAGGAEDTLGFARRLARTGQSGPAAVEYERFLFLHPDHPRAPSARLEAAEVYLKLGRIDRAAAVLGPIDLARADRIAGRAIILRARALALTGQTEDARQLLAQLADREQFPTPVREAALYRLGWLELDQGRWRTASEAFARISPEGALGARAAWLAKEALRGLELEYKSPTVAGILSALPGLGQLYQSRFADAGWAFGLTVGSGVLSWLALAGGSWVSGAILAGAALAFYGGNIYNAVSGAHRHNDSLVRDFRRRLRSAAAGIPATDTSPRPKE